MLLSTVPFIRQLKSFVFLQLTEQDLVHVEEHPHASSPSACFLRKANMPSPLFGFSMGGWEQVESMDHSSLSVPGRRDICWRLFTSSGRGLSIICLWFGTEGGRLNGRSFAKCLMALNHSQVATVASPLSVSVPVGDSSVPINNVD